MTMISEAIILAGGLGTRLRSAVPDIPKCMAPVAGKPFISYLILYLQQQGVTKLIFSLGFMHESIEEYLKHAYPALEYTCSVEEEPLGTGGAIRKACAAASSSQVLVLNGDTFFKVGLQGLQSFHAANTADCSLSLKPMVNSSRYGVVELDDDDSVKSFREKQFYTESNINGGVYALNRDSFLREELPLKFSFEKDYLERFYTTRRMYGFIQDAYFIDIGIPEDYLRAQTELPENIH